jgi:hypothetical protein
MGLKPAADRAQATMSKVFAGSDSAADEHFFDDVGMFNTNWSSHVRKVVNVLKCLETKGFTVNLCKCALAVSNGIFCQRWTTCHKQVDEEIKLMIVSHAFY